MQVALADSFSLLGRALMEETPRRTYPLSFLVNIWVLCLTANNFAGNVVDCIQRLHASRVPVIIPLVGWLQLLPLEYIFLFGCMTGCGRWDVSRHKLPQDLESLCMIGLVLLCFCHYCDQNMPGLPRRWVIRTGQSWAAWLSPACISWLPGGGEPPQLPPTELPTSSQPTGAGAQLRFLLECHWDAVFVMQHNIW